MAWIGLRTRYEAAFNTAGLGRAQLPAPVTDDSLLTRGSLMAEVIVSPVNRPTNLLRYAVLDPWPAAFTIVQEPNGTFRLLLRNGPRDLAVSLDTDLGSTPETVTLTYSWDAPARIGRFGIYAPDRAQLWLVDVPAPPPLALRDGYRLISDQVSTRVNDDVSFVALGNRPAPMGPMPGIRGDAQIETVTGPRPIWTLRAGDEVIAGDGGTAQIRWSGHVDLPAAGRHVPWTLRQPYHGLTADLVLTPDQRLCLTGPEIEYQFGEEAVSTALRHLVDRHSITPQKEHAAIQRWHQVLLDRPVAILANGAWIESFDAAPLYDGPHLFDSSVLAALPAELRPSRHGRGLPILSAYEALTLTGASYG